MRPHTQTPSPVPGQEATNFMTVICEFLGQHEKRWLEFTSTSSKNLSLGKSSWSKWTTLTNYCKLPVIFSPWGFISSLLFGRTQADMISLYQGHISDSSIHCSSFQASPEMVFFTSFLNRLVRRNQTRWFQIPLTTPSWQRIWKRGFWDRML